MASRRAVLATARLHSHPPTTPSSFTRTIPTTPKRQPSQPPRKYSTTTQSQTRPHKRKTRKIPLLITTAILGTTIYYLLSPPSRPTLLNSETFVPYSITSREAISPTSFIFTIRPHSPNPSSLPYLVPSSSSSSWRYPLWSVEFKQPQVQIARHYTPLPPLDGQQLDAADDGSLSFYVRAIGGGEMSTYLSRLGAGQDVWLRGPHVGFDVAARLGRMNNVVFLAGGTGVVPAMQVAKAVLDNNNNKSSETRVTILWAIRKREELQQASAVRKQPSWWHFWTGKGSSEPEELDNTQLQHPSPIAQRLIALKAKYGPRLRIQVAIDEEQTNFRELDLQKVISPEPSSPLSRSNSAPGCRLHDAAMLELAPEFEAPAAADDCKCGSGAGKNLFMVSGPDGFIAHYAGPKRWLAGQQVQGPVGGVAARLQRRHPWLADDWLVLKL